MKASEFQVVHDVRRVVAEMFKPYNQLMRNKEMNEITYTGSNVAAILNEWVRRFADNPEEFGELLQADGRPFDDYGSNGAAYFEFLRKELGL